MKHTIQVLVENKFGVLARVSSLFSARGYNIDSLAVGRTQDPTLSCMTIVVEAENERILEQIKKQLHKLIDVFTVIDLTKRPHIDKELFLVKLELRRPDDKIKLSQIEKNFNVRKLHEEADTVIIEFCGGYEEIRSFRSEIKSLEIKELIRSGRIAIAK